MKRVLLALAVGMAPLPAPADSTICTPSSATASVAEVVRRIEEERIKHVFVGERHSVGPVKRFIVDLGNHLVDRGHDVGLYVEGFRAGCVPGEARCDDLAELFNPQAFSTLLRESRAPVRGIDPPGREARARRMAAAIEAGGESVRLILVGNAHVRGAWDAAAEAYLYGGALRYPDPGDVVEAFPQEESITVVLEPRRGFEGLYTLLADGCAADYRLLAPPLSAY